MFSTDPDKLELAELAVMVTQNSDRWPSSKTVLSGPAAAWLRVLFFRGIELPSIVAVIIVSARTEVVYLTSCWNTWRRSGV